jgi:hypothetical protein
LGLGLMVASPSFQLAGHTAGAGWGCDMIMSRHS